MDPWLINPPWQNFSSMYREAVSATEAMSEVERRHHKTAALYFGIAALEAFLNQKMRAFLTSSKTEPELLKVLRYAKFTDKVRKWPTEILGTGLALPPSTTQRIEDFNDIRAGLTHAKTRGYDVYEMLEALQPDDVVHSIAEYMVRFHEAESTKYPYWVFGWNYLNPEGAGHEIIVLNDQQFAFSLRTFGVQIGGGYGWEEEWKNRFFKTYDGYIHIRDLLRSRAECEPKYTAFPRQPKLCRRWWTAEHHKTCGALIRG
jgi:hypothetical protein